ncbi:hypothetical protein [Enhygromyxa salina]|uniref:hypothetical protein n=1 Tax=Enhygromyxa salina TaxID=215803 RepID=UPI000D092EBB|nr:hypothetical protein [Enhygromyxa salina]
MASGQDDRDGLFVLFLDDDGVFADDETNALFAGSVKQIERSIEDRVPGVVAAVFARVALSDDGLDAGCDGEMIDIG